MSNGRTAFVGVNLVPMDREAVIPNQTVLVEGQRISAVGLANEISLPPDTIVKICQDKYLMPGLCDMHVHNWTESEFVLFLANGVTTIRNMWGSPRHLAWREKIFRGEMLGPTIYTTGPLIDGSPPIWSSCKVIDNAGEVSEEVSSEKRSGYDFLKVYNRLSAKVYEAIAAEAKRHNIRFVGHVPYSVGLKRATELGQSSIEHLNGYLEVLQLPDSPYKDKHDWESRLRSVDFVDRSAIPAIANFTAQSDTWNCVTLVVFQRALASNQAKRLCINEEQMKYVPPMWMADWKTSLDEPSDEKIASNVVQELCQRRDALLLQLTNSLHVEGAPILLGTDTPNPFVIPGFSIHEELRNLLTAGLSPYESLRAGTVNAAKFLEAEKEFGTIEPGKRADLILLGANPLEDVTFLSTKLLGVMVRGTWLEKSVIERQLEELLSSYKFGASLSQLSNENRVSSSPEGRRYLYEIGIADIPLGQEEVSVFRESNSRVSTIQSRVALNAPPYTDYFEMLIEPGASNFAPRHIQFRAERSEGTSKLEIKQDGGVFSFQEVVAGLEDELAWSTRIREEKVIAGCPWFAGTYFQLGDSLNEGEETERLNLIAINVELGLEVNESTLEIAKSGKENSHEGGKQYALSDKRRYAEYKGRIVLSDAGVPVSMSGPSMLYSLNHRLINS